MGLGSHLWGSHGSGILLLGLRIPLMGLGAQLWGSHGSGLPLMGQGRHLWVRAPTYGSEDPT